MGLTELAIRRPLTVLMGILALVLMGGVAYTYLKVDRLPPVTIGVVSISVTWPNASADNVERLVAEPLENAVSGVSGIDTITSSSNEGQCTVIVQLADGYDPNQADIDIQQQMGPVIRQLPTEASAPVVRKFDPNAFPILNVAFTGGPLDSLYDIASNQIQPDLESVPGVGQVSISGGLVQEIQVQVDYSKLAAYGLTVNQVQTALVNDNVSVPAGSVPAGAQIINVVPQGLFQSIADIQNVVLSDNGTSGPVTVADVASVAQGDKQQFNLQRLNGQDAVGLSITANSDANQVQVADATRAELNRLQTLLPQGTTMTVVNDQSIFTRASLSSIQHDLILAIILVAAVILVFLHDWKHTVIVLCAIPTSLISTFLVMYLLGFTLNTMSMMALALMIGILVDDSIVVLENIHRHLQLGETPWQAALIGRSEIGMAAIAITMADVVVYTPIAFMSGSIGQLFKQYGLTVVAATLFSLLMSFTLTPMLASRWLGHNERPGYFHRLTFFARWWDRNFQRLSHAFANSVKHTVRARWLVLLVAGLMVAGVAAMIPLRILGTEYAPAEDDNNLQVSLQLPPGTSLDATNQAAQQLESYVAQMPEVTYYFTSVSIPGGGGFNSGGASTVSMQVQTVDKSQRQRSVFDLINLLRTQSRQIPSATFSGGVSSPLPGGGGGGAGGISMQISGPDLDTINQVAGSAQQALLTVPGISDVQNNSLSTVPQVNVVFNRPQMALLGISKSAVDTILATSIGGVTQTQLQPEGQQAQDITVVAANNSRFNLTTLSQIPVGTGPASTSVVNSPTNIIGGSASSTSSASASGGPVVTLGQIATLSQATGPVTIQRVNRQDTVSISATPVGRPLGDVASDVQHTVNSLAFPVGVTITLRGQVQTFNQAITALASALALSLVLEYMLLVALYESWLFPLVRMLTIPLGMVGAFLLLWATGNTINIFSIIGMIMGEGLVAKSGILLVDYTNTLRERGWSRVQALEEAVRVRLRPILMTSCTMIFGMLPLALKLEEGAETRAPMAVVVIGALLSSTLLTLIVVPALYTVIDDIQNKFAGRKPVAAPVPAEQERAEVAAALAGRDGVSRTTGRAERQADGHAEGLPLDVVDGGDTYLVRAMLPGVKYEDVQLTVRDHTLSISTEHRPEQDVDGGWVVHENARGRWERSFALPREVDDRSVSATYQDGIVIELRLAKVAVAPARPIPNGHGARSAPPDAPTDADPH